MNWDDICVEMIRDKAEELRKTAESMEKIFHLKPEIVLVGSAYRVAAASLDSLADDIEVER